jgi:hypothetical protein
MCVLPINNIGMYVLDPMILVLVVSAGADKHQVLAG